MRRSTAPGLSLFPFLSVLMCAIGVMVIVFTGTVLTKLESTNQSWAVSIRDVPPRRPGREFKREPIYVVCDGTGLEVYWSPRERRKVTPEMLSESRREATIRDLVDEIERRAGERWPVFFVKPSGLAYMTPLYEAVKGRNLKVGSFAFSEESSIVCEAFRDEPESER